MLIVKSGYVLHCLPHSQSATVTQTHARTHARRFSHGVPGAEARVVWLGSHAARGGSASVARLGSHAARGGCGGYGSVLTLRVVAMVAVAWLARCMRSGRCSWRLTQNDVLVRAPQILVIRWLPQKI